MARHVAQAIIPSCWEAEAGPDHLRSEFETSLDNMVKLYQK